jgi:alkylation response protein AidB-like acyl-CoA dehydrogenase
LHLSLNAVQQFIRDTVLGICVHFPVDFLQRDGRGGMGYAKEHHVALYLREVLVTRSALLSPLRILNFIAEDVLDLPKS